MIVATPLSDGHKLVFRGLEPQDSHAYRTDRSEQVTLRYCSAES